MSTGDFHEELARSGTMAWLVQCNAKVRFGQSLLVAACNRLRSADRRLSSWLLMSRDRVGIDRFMITQEFFGQMLGPRRTTVPLAASVL